MKPVALTFVLLTATSAPAFANADLAQKKNCLACHAVDAKRIGPAYKDVAAKYADSKEALATLSSKVVLPWSTWAMMAMLRICRVISAKSLEMKNQDRGGTAKWSGGRPWLKRAQAMS